jgi:hypothetical protein
MIFNREKHFQTGQISIFNFRKKRALFIKEIIQFIFNENQRCNIIDLGGTEEFWNIIDTDFLYENNVKITLINLHPYEIKNKQIFKMHHMDFFSLNPKDFPDFDLSFSNSVIEHLENNENQKKFANLQKIIAKYFYCQTPNKFFFIEPHFVFPLFQFLPKRIQIFLLKNFRMGNFAKLADEKIANKHLSEIKLLSKKELSILFPNISPKKEKLFFLTKSFIINNLENRFSS